MPFSNANSVAERRCYPLRKRSDRGFAQVATRLEESGGSNDEIACCMRDCCGSAWRRVDCGCCDRGRTIHRIEWHHRACRRWLWTWPVPWTRRGMSPFRLWSGPGLVGASVLLRRPSGVGPGTVRRLALGVDAQLLTNSRWQTPAERQGGRGELCREHADAGCRRARLHRIALERVTLTPLPPEAVPGRRAIASIGSHRHRAVFKVPEQD